MRFKKHSESSDSLQAGAEATNLQRVAREVDSSSGSEERSSKET